MLEQMTRTIQRDIEQILNFAALIQEKLPDCKVFILASTLRSDNAKANPTVKQLTNYLL